MADKKKLGNNQAYCVVCKKGVKVQNGKYVQSTKNGRTTYRLTGDHTVGGKTHKLSKIVSKDTYEKNA